MFWARSLLETGSNDHTHPPHFSGHRATWVRRQVFISVCAHYTAEMLVFYQVI